MRARRAGSTAQLYAWRAPRISLSAFCAEFDTAGKPHLAAETARPPATHRPAAYRRLQCRRYDGYRRAWRFMTSEPNFEAISAGRTSSQADDLTRRPCRLELVSAYRTSLSLQWLKKRICQCRGERRTFLCSTAPRSRRNAIVEVTLVPNERRVASSPRK